MAKKNIKIIPYEDTAKWLCTFNDLMTLLLTFFVLILSMSSLNAAKIKDLQAQLIDALGVMEFGKSEQDPIIEQLFSLEDMGSKQQIIRSIKKLDKKGIQIKDFVAVEIPPELLLKDFTVLKQEGKKEYNEQEIIFNQFEKLIDENFFEPGITVIKRERGIVLRLNEKVLFAPGSARVKERAFITLGKIASIIIKTSLKISIEGHTDSTPVNKKMFASNWELSMKRALNVLDFYVNKGLVNPDKFYVTGFADSLPVKNNNTEENRSENRRIELVFTKS
jgi:chemotaxis protein MotB